MSNTRYSSQGVHVELNKNSIALCDRFDKAETGVSGPGPGRGMRKRDRRREGRLSAPSFI